MCLMLCVWLRNACGGCMALTDVAAHPFEGQALVLQAIITGGPTLRVSLPQLLACTEERGRSTHEVECVQAQA